MRFTTFNLAHKLFAVLLLYTCCCVVLAADPAPTDDLLWEEGYPKGLEIVPPTPGSYWIASRGTTNKKKYPEIKIIHPVVEVIVYQLDPTGKEMPKTRRIFINAADTDVQIATGKWFVSGRKLSPDRKDFSGYPGGKYRVIVTTSVKRTPDAEVTPAVLIATIDVPTPVVEDPEP